MSNFSSKNSQKGKMKKYKTGMVFGTFDLFHKGHEFYITEAKKMVDKLIIVVARDARVQSLKNLIPSDSEAQRQKNIANFCQHSESICVILGDEKDILAPIAKHCPDILIFGYDQKVPENILEEKFPHIATTRIASFEPERYKSSILRNKNPQ